MTRLNRTIRVVVGVAMSTYALTKPSIASPLGEGFVGGIGFNGPVSPTLAAVYWNPAALGKLRGGRLEVAGHWDRVSLSVDRTSTFQQTGLPGGDRRFGRVGGAASSSPSLWPPSGNTFLGAGGNVANRFSIAVALYTPFHGKSVYEQTPDLPTRYHSIASSTVHTALSAGWLSRLPDRFTWACQRASCSRKRAFFSTRIQHFPEALTP